MTQVCCYSCRQPYTADIDDLDTVCPKCGSDSYVRINL